MNRQELETTIKNFSEMYNIPADKMIIIAGSAVCLLGIMDETNDLDVCIPEEYYNTLDEGWMIKEGRFGLFKSKIIDNIAIDTSPANYDLYLKTCITRPMDGIHIMTAPDVIELKKKNIIYLEHILQEGLIEEKPKVYLSGINAKIAVKKEKLAALEKKMLNILNSNIGYLVMRSNQCTCNTPTQQNRKPSMMRPPKKGNVNNGKS